jgi:hypothetical protein
VSPRLGGAALLLLAFAPGCRRGDIAEKSGPRLEVRWTGADTAGFAAPATVEWCDSLNLLETRAVAGDAGVELALYRRGGISPGSYPIRRPDTAATAQPAAAIGLRWFSETAVQGYQSSDGEVSVQRAPGGAVAGRFTAKASAVGGSGRLELAGSFEGVRVHPEASGCHAPPPRDTSAGVH